MSRLSILHWKVQDIDILPVTMKSGEEENIWIERVEETG